MTRTVALLAAAGTLTLVAACDDALEVADGGAPAPVTPGPAPSRDAEAGCVAALAEQLGVDPGQVSSTDVRAREGGQDVFLILDDAPWRCQVDDAGNVLGLELAVGTDDFYVGAGDGSA